MKKHLHGFVNDVPSQGLIERGDDIAHWGGDDACRINHSFAESSHHIVHIQSGSRTHPPFSSRLLDAALFVTHDF